MKSSEMPWYCISIQTSWKLRKMKNTCTHGTYPIRGSFLGVSISVHDVTKEKANQIHLNTTIRFEIDVIRVFSGRLLPIENERDCHYFTNIKKMSHEDDTCGATFYLRLNVCGQNLMRQTKAMQHFAPKTFGEKSILQK